MTLPRPRYRLSLYIVNDIEYVIEEEHISFTISKNQNLVFNTNQN